jgi:hypothetical protein
MQLHKRFGSEQLKGLSRRYEAGEVKTVTKFFISIKYYAKTPRIFYIAAF